MNLHGLSRLHLAVAASLVLAAATPSCAHAQASTVDTPAPRPPDGRVRALPDTEPLRRAFMRSGRARVDMVLFVRFDARGRVTEAAVLEGSDPAVDPAILTWARGVVVETTEAGVARLPVVFRFDDAPWDAFAGARLPPVPESILGLARAAGLERLTCTLALHYRDGALWNATLKPGSGDDATDAALLAWVREVPALVHDGVVSEPLSEALYPVVAVPKQKTP